MSFIPQPGDLFTMSENGSITGLHLHDTRVRYDTGLGRYHFSLCVLSCNWFGNGFASKVQTTSFIANDGNTYVRTLV